MSYEAQEFKDFDEYTKHNALWLKSRPNTRAICFDQQGRLCASDADFRRARDEKTFPVRWIWPDQVGGIVVQYVRHAQLVNQITAYVKSETATIEELKEALK